MSDNMSENQVSSSEIEKAEAMLSPVERAMSRVRAQILGPLEEVKMPEEEAEVIRKYSDMAGEVARKEFNRLQEESPAKRIEDVFAHELQNSSNPTETDFLDRAIWLISQRVGEWQDSVSEDRGVAAITRQSKTLQQSVVDQIALGEKQLKKGVPPKEMSGIAPSIGPIVTDKFNQYGSIKENAAKAVRTERILKSLGFLPQAASMKSLFALPEPERFAPEYSRDQLEELRWGDIPKKVNLSKVTGLHSDSMPGVTVEVKMFGSNEVLIRFIFKPEAIAKCVSIIPGVSGV